MNKQIFSFFVYADAQMLFSASALQREVNQKRSLLFLDQILIQNGPMRTHCGTVIDCFQKICLPLCVFAADQLDTVRKRDCLICVIAVVDSRS